MTAITSVGIIGAGTMGTGIAINLAQHGLAVALFDAQAAQLERARAAAAEFFERAAQKGRLSADAAAAARGRIEGVGELGALGSRDLVIEAVFEDFDLKARLLAELTPRLDDRTLVATNTSCLRVSDLQRHISRPERFLGLHYFSPAAVNPVVEVVKGEATNDAVIEAALAFCRATGKLPLRCKDNYGFAVNRFFCPYTNEAARLVDEGVASVGQIDQVARDAVGAAAGPFTVMNIIKPRINLHAIRNLEPLGSFYAPARSMAATGDADQSWTIDQDPPLAPAGRAQVIDRLRMGVFLPVLQALDEEVAPPADIDLGAREALRFADPPCALMTRLGADEVGRIVAPGMARYGIALPKSLARLGNLGV